MSVTVQIHNDVMARAIAKLRAQGVAVKSHTVSVGIHDELGSAAAVNYAGKEGKQSIAYVALAHEYGAGVPERSWFRSWFDAKVERMRSRMLGAMQNERAGREDAIPALARFWAENLKEWIGEDQAQLTPLADSTVKAREAAGLNGEIPLFAQGQIAHAITAQVDGQEV